MTQDKPKPPVYYCNRPKLAGKLISKGYKPDFQTNPWNPKLTTWGFIVDLPLCQIVADYYREIGKETPTFIQNFMEGGKTV